MKPVYIVGAHATSVAEHYEFSLADLALEALRGAFKMVTPALEPERIGAIYVANAFGEALVGQANLGAALASAAGLSGIDALRVEAAGASGGLALRQAAMAVICGTYDLVAVLGAEKVTDKLEDRMEAAQMLSIDSDTEADIGATLTSQWALLMRRYMHEYGYEAADFAPFPINAHSNGKHNREALYRFSITAEKYLKAPQIASPLNMLDCSSLGDGAAVVLVASERLARELTSPRVRIGGSGLSTDTAALYQRRDPLLLNAARQSAATAMQQAGVVHADIDVLEFTDPHSIAAALALEASRFVDRGAAPRHAADGGITVSGATPIATAGGYKARGDVGGANGVYQLVELVRQLQGNAGAAQVPNARVAFAQCLGGVGSTAISHILLAE